ncbi:MAG: hypothetical protein D3922_01750 [Candidatus Electrothrix sp. AR1]|nr:hypothetical protein [Candidatus Electrothrix sp. AR1]
MSNQNDKEGTSDIVCFMTGKACSRLNEHNTDGRKNDKKQKKVFVIIPFKQPYFDYYTFAIKEHYSSRNWECTYGGESTFSSGEYIICKICQEIYKSSLIIADLSEKNPNVYYELGIAHALGKKTIPIFNEKIKNKRNSSLLNFLSIHCRTISYKSIENLKYALQSRDAGKLQSEHTGTPAFPIPDNEIKSISSEEYTAICLIPKGSSKKNKTFNYSEIYEFGIKKGIMELEFPGIDLINLKYNDIRNIIFDAQYRKFADLKKIIQNICNSRYCIIDISEKKYPDIFYWLGFIHGLRVNKKIGIRKDLICIYITNGRMKELPFDIRAAKVIHYNDIEDINFKIQREIERLEVAKIDKKNTHKKSFWKRFNLKNTEFILGAADSYPPEEEDARSRISIQDFKSYNRIVYQILFNGSRIPFQYKMRPLELSRYLQENNKNEYDTDKLNKIFTKDSAHKHNDKNEWENYIIIGSSCVNPAAEKVMRSLYGKNIRILSKTIRRYKSRSLFTKCILDDKPVITCKHCETCQDKNKYCPHKNKNKISDKEKRTIIKNNTGIFIKNKENKKDTPPHGRRELQENGKPKKETALLIICSKNYVVKDHLGEIIILSGFGKYGTFELSRVLSRVNTEDKLSQKYKNITIKCKLDWECGCEFGIEDFFYVINSIRGEGKPYCIEAVFEFDFQPEETSENESIENNSLKLEKSFLKWFCLFDPEKGNEEDLLSKLRERRN